MRNLFKRGFEAMEEESKRGNVRRTSGKFINEYFLRDGEEDVPVRFLTDEPVSFWCHQKQEGNRWVKYACSCTPDCPLCKEGVPRKYIGAYLVVDGRKGSYTKKSGETATYQDRISILARTSDVAGIQRNFKKYGLTDRCYLATRSGVGASTSYLFDRVDDVFEMYPELDSDIYAFGELSEAGKQKIQDLLPDKYKGMDYYEIIADFFPVSNSPDELYEVEEPSSYHDFSSIQRVAD